MILANPTFSGSINISGSLNLNGTGIGATATSASLATTAERVRAGSSGSRPTVAESGSLWFNTDTLGLEVYTGVSQSLWQPVDPASRTAPTVPSGVDTFDFFEDSSAVLHYKLDSNANDNGGVYNTTATNSSYITGKFGQGISTVQDLSATGGSNTLPSGLEALAHPFADNATELTISLWINRPNTANPVYITGMSYNGGQRGYAITVTGTSTTALQGDGISQSANSFRVYCAGNTNTDIVEHAGYSTANFPINTWTHFAFVFQASTTSWKMYINGSLESTVTNAAWTKLGDISGNTTPSNKVAWFGIPYTNVSGGQSFDQVRVFNRVLTANEITSLSNES